MLNRFIEQLSKELRWSQPIEKEEDGSYHLLFEPNLNVNLKQTSDSQVTFSSNLGGVPEEKQEEFFLKLMKANLLGRETGGGFLGLNAEGKEVTFLFFLLGSISYKTFKDALEDFINYADVWKDETKVAAYGQKK